jgi:hypothetical protein
VLGWSGPRIRSLAARVCSCSGIASAARPAARYAIARLFRADRVSGWSEPSSRSSSASSGSPTAMACAALSPSSFRWYSAHSRSPRSELASSSPESSSSPATVCCSAATCWGMSLAARRSGDVATAFARVSSMEAAARHITLSRPRRARLSRMTRMTSGCTTTALPSSVKVVSDHSASRSRARLTKSAATTGRRLRLARRSACRAACSNSRGTPAADSTAINSISPAHTSPASPVRIASMDSSTASAAARRYG